MKFIKFNTLLNILLIVALGWFLVRKFVLKPAFSGGEKIATFEATLLNGQPFRLEQLQGSYVLLDFWGSWCGPCRHENASLVELYRKYNQSKFKDANSFQIVSVAIERNEQSWRKAIAADRLEWPYHVLDKSMSLKLFTSPLARQYGVRQIPTTFFIDPQGEVLGVNWTARQVDTWLQGQVL